MKRKELKVGELYLSTFKSSWHNINDGLLIYLGPEPPSVSNDQYLGPLLRFYLIEQGEFRFWYQRQVNEFLDKEQMVKQ